MLNILHFTLLLGIDIVLWLIIAFVLCVLYLIIKEQTLKFFRNRKDKKLTDEINKRYK